MKSNFYFMFQRFDGALCLYYTQTELRQKNPQKTSSSKRRRQGPIGTTFHPCKSRFIFFSLCYYALRRSKSFLQDIWQSSTRHNSLWYLAPYILFSPTVTWKDRKQVTDTSILESRLQSSPKSFTAVQPMIVFRPQNISFLCLKITDSDIAQ